MVKSVVLGVVAASLLLVAGCSNTFEGAGRDVENMGEWMQDTF